jgi:hypothetical protein
VRIGFFPDHLSPDSQNAKFVARAGISARLATPTCDGARFAMAPADNPSRKASSMQKFTIAVLSLSLSLFAIGCGGTAPAPAPLPMPAAGSHDAGAAHDHEGEMTNEQPAGETPAEPAAAEPAAAEPTPEN